MATLMTIPELQDFDDKHVYDQCQNAVLQADTLNFVIEFNSVNARAATNLGVEPIQEFLQTERSSGPSTRWINIWAPEKQTAVIKRLARLYNFSPRLTGIMISENYIATPVPQEKYISSPRALYNKIHDQYRGRPSVDTQSPDPEKDEKTMYRPSNSQMKDLNHYKVVNQVWHYCSVDWGSKYLCIGYNSLSDTEVAPDIGFKGTQNSSEREDDIDHTDASARFGNNPKGARTWTWLVLCDDGTIISLYENPFPGHQRALDYEQQSRLKLIRRNLHNVFKQLSKVNDTHRRDNPIHTLDIRPGLESNQTSNITIADSPSLLFYYLFDDWYTSYALVAKTEHAYAELLEKLRKDMFQKPHLELIQLLHQYGRQLSVLKRMYQSYELIIQRILDRQKPVNKPSGGETISTASRAMGAVSRSSHTTARITDDSSLPAGETFGAPLSAAATVRFERLQDRITHYAISEIQECLDEKEALVFLNFNLITLKESQAVERLTRITILLAKVTILFMPVSLMTAYFSTQLSDLANIYTIKTYWICFGVIMTLSLVFLMIFGALSGTLEGKPIYKSLTQTVLDAGKLKWRARKVLGRSRK